MFGIGLPELILIVAVGLVVVGPDKLPELAKSLAKGIGELKKAAGSLKESLEEDESWKEVKNNVDELTDAYKDLPAPVNEEGQPGVLEDPEAPLPEGEPGPDAKHQEIMNKLFDTIDREDATTGDTEETRPEDTEEDPAAPAEENKP